MPNENYKRAKIIKSSLSSEISELHSKLLKFKNHSEELYELLRWQDLGCSQLEYEKLSTGFCWEIEEADGFYHMDCLINLLEKLNKK